MLIDIVETRVMNKPVLEAKDKLDLAESQKTSCSCAGSLFSP